MRAYFAAQPWDGGRNLGDFLTDATGETTADSRLRIAVAWTRSSGIGLAAPHFAKVTDAGGTVDLITGLSAGGATRQGLERAMEVCTTVHVAFDVSGATFHPKLYLYRGQTINRLLVTSSNLTAGGFFRNVEAGVTVEGTDDETELFNEVDGWLDELVADSALVRPLTAELLEELVADPRYKIGDETANAKGNAAASPKAESGHFAKSSRKRRYVVLPGGDAVVEISAETEAAVPTLPSTPPAVLHVWSKALSDSDALRPPKTTSKVTGALRLGKSVFPIDKNTFFIEELFASADWATEGKKLLAVIPFRTTINGFEHGVHPLKVDFFESRIADQNNVPTVLHWGSLTSILKSGDYRNHWVVLRSLSDGSFELEIKPSPEVDDLPPAT